MKFFIFGFLAALVVVVLVGAGYFAFGLAPVATNSSPMPFERLIAHVALKAAIKKSGSPPTPPMQASEEVFLAGARIYRDDCAVCHGLPGQEKTLIAKGEFPKPPQLFMGKGVSDDPAGITYWKVRNGIRLSGMPGFNGSLSDEQIWQVSLLLANSDKLPAGVQAFLHEALSQSSVPGK